MAHAEERSNAKAKGLLAKKKPVGLSRGSLSKWRKKLSLYSTTRTSVFCSPLAAAARAKLTDWMFQVYFQCSLGAASFVRLSFASFRYFFCVLLLHRVCVLFAHASVRPNAHTHARAHVEPAIGRIAYAAWTVQGVNRRTTSLRREKDM